MRQGRLSSRSLSAQELCEVTVLVPKDCAERIRQFAQELRARQHAEPLPTRLEWQTVSPSAELAAGENRFRWTVAVLGQLDPIAEGRAKERAEASWLAETALDAFVQDW